MAGIFTFCVKVKFGMTQKENTHCRINENMIHWSHGAIVLQGGLTFIPKRMGVVHMKNKFSFNDLMQFGIFLLALLTFIYMISH